VSASAAAAVVTSPPGKGPLLKSLAVQASGAALWGVFFAIAPIVEVLFMGAIIWIPLLVWREMARSKRHGFHPGILVRAAVVSAVVAIAIVAPVKDEDQRRVEGLTGNRGSLEELSKAVRMNVPEDRKHVQILLPSHRPSYRQVTRSIRQQTGMECRSIGCATGMTVLRGPATTGIHIARY